MVEKISKVLKVLNNPLSEGLFNMKLKPSDKVIKFFSEKDEYFGSVLMDFFDWGINQINKDNIKEKEKATDFLKYNNLLLGERSETIFEKTKSSKEIFNKVKYKKMLKEFLNFKDFFKIKDFEKKRMGVLSWNIDSQFFSPKKNKFLKMRYSVKSGSLNFYSFNKDLLDSIGDILRKIDDSIEYSVIKIYSPEKDIFEVYPLLFARFSFGKITSNKKIIDNLRRASPEMYDNKEDSSIRFIGFALEELFTEMYEIIVRERFLSSEGLKQMYDLLSKKIGNIFSNKEQNLLESLGDSPMENVLKLIKKDLEELKKKSGFVKEKILFPVEIQNSIEIIRKYRNQISHKYSGSLSFFDSAVCLRSFVNILIWWEYIKRNVKDWNGTRKDVLMKELIPASKMFEKSPNFEIFDNS